MDPANVIISDILMPQMDGLTFLAQARALRPEVPQMILSGYAERQASLAGAGRSGAFAFLEKPWNNETLLGNIRTAINSPERLIAGAGVRRNAFA